MPLRKARAADIPSLLALINGYAARNLLLPRTSASLRSAMPGRSSAITNACETRVGA